LEFWKFEFFAPLQLIFGGVELIGISNLLRKLGNLRKKRKKRKKLEFSIFCISCEIFAENEKNYKYL